MSCTHTNLLFIFSKNQSFLVTPFNHPSLAQTLIMAIILSKCSNSYTWIFKNHEYHCLWILLFTRVNKCTVKRNVGVLNIFHIRIVFFLNQRCLVHYFCLMLWVILMDLQWYAKRSIAKSPHCFSASFHLHSLYLHLLRSAAVIIKTCHGALLYFLIRHLNLLSFTTQCIKIVFYCLKVLYNINKKKNWIETTLSQVNVGWCIIIILYVMLSSICFVFCL